MLSFQKSAKGTSRRNEMTILPWKIIHYFLFFHFSPESFSVSHSLLHTHTHTLTQVSWLKSSPEDISREELFFLCLFVFWMIFSEVPRDGGAWWAAVSGVAQSWTQLKRLSSSSSSSNTSEHFQSICWKVCSIWSSNLHDFT